MAKELPEVGTPEWDELCAAIKRCQEAARKDIDDWNEATRVTPEAMRKVIGPGPRGWPHNRR